ncbi:MAG: hypothetical protein KDE27_08390 [Planctomycetes bacterium]|nr:hypothetical protein [Planctomycetota bacterium]
MPVILAGLPACAAVTTIATPELDRPRPLPVAGTPLFDWKGIVHCHGFLSHDSDGTMEEIADACGRASIDFVVMTDHQSEASIRDGTRGMVGDTLFVVGAEVRAPQGTILAFPLVAPLRHFQHPGLLAKEAAAQGGLAFVCHGERWQIGFDVPELCGVEIVNLHAGAMTANRFGTLLTGLFLPFRYLFERICVRDPVVFDAWDHALAERHPFTPVGGNDAHANVRVFGPLGGTIGNYREVFSTLSTHVLAEHLDEVALVEAFRRGRTYVAFDVFGDGAGFDFRAVDGDRVELGGADVVTAATLTLRVRTPGPGQIALLRDGVVLRSANGRDLVETDPAPGVYRVEVQTPGGDPWLFSSTIRVLADPARRD